MLARNIFQMPLVSTINNNSACQSKSFTMCEKMVIAKIHCKLRSVFPVQYMTNYSVHVCKIVKEKKSQLFTSRQASGVIMKATWPCWLLQGSVQLKLC